MKMQALLSAVLGVGLLLVLNGARMGSARHSWHAKQTLFVFGDSFVDSGNLPVPLGDNTDEMFRQWYYPYGISNDEAKRTEPQATGRFSDFMVESDFVAKMLGLPRSPPPYQTLDYCSPSGLNFAFATSGVFEVSIWMNLRDQVGTFERMVKSGTLTKNTVTHSIALIASSANDYKHFGVHRNPHENSEFIRNVTTEIAANVERLQSLGVKRILVSNLHPLGCTPSLCRARDYSECDDASNNDAYEHNSNLEQKLGNKKGVFIVDLHTAFENIMGLAEDSESTYEQFEQKRKPCCESIHPTGFCGQHDDNGNTLYSLCEDPSKYFFWDDAHPTHAGWDAVMTQLQDPIKKFLGVV